MIFMASVLLGRGVRQQRDRESAPDGARELALVPRAASRDAPRSDLAALRHEVAEPAHVLEIDQVDLVHTELADLAPAEPAPLRGLPCWRNGLASPCGVERRRSPPRPPTTTCNRWR